MTQVEELKISGQLPSPKGVALAILELSRRDTVTLGEIARVVQTDPALSGRLIKLANSASQITRPVVSVQEAVVRQGMNSVRQLALGFSLLDQHRSGGCAAFDYPAYWSHSLLMALAMQALGSRMRLAAADELFVCGLLAQIGKLALATVYPDEYKAVLTQHQAAPIPPLLVLERTHLATDHCELGIAMMAEWGIPAIFTEPLAHYEDPEHGNLTHDSRANSLMLTLHLAHLLGDYGLASAAARPQLAAQWIKQAQAIDISPERAGEIIDKVIADWREWGVLLNVSTTALPPFSQVTTEQTESQDITFPLRILVADSNELSRRRVMARLVENSVHVVYPASDGNAALALALEVLPHVIIAQRDLPRLSGVELCHALRATEEGQRIHILLMADEHGEAPQLDAIDAGADGYMPSDTTAPCLHSRLASAQRLAQLQDAWEKDRAQLRQIAAELAVANRRLGTAALTDALTGLPNRRAAMEQLQQVWGTATRAGTPLSAIMIDIDHFKPINDTYGHAVGDAVLREVANTLRASARQGDSVCRIGGEEFLVICPNTDVQSAVQSAERLRLTLQARLIQAGQAQLKVTASFGVATKLDHTADIDALISASDQALYAAKQAGRNRTATR